MNELLKYREDIDYIDNEILKLISKRIELVKSVWYYKKSNNMNALQSDRWKQVLSSKIELWETLWINSILVENIWNSIHDESLNIENDILKS